MNHPFCPKITPFFLLLFCAAGYRATSQQPLQMIHITVDATDIRNTIPPTMFGTCMEDVNHEIYGGLYAQLIMGESFEEPASGINYNEWKKSGGYWAVDREYSDGSISIVPGRHTRRMVGTTDLDVEPDGSARLIYDKERFRDGVMETDLRFLQARGNGGSILLRTSNVGIGRTALTGYEVRLNRETGKLQLIKHRNDEQVLIESPFTFNPDGWNHLKTEFQKGQITVYCNNENQPVLSYNDVDQPILEGYIGLATSGAPLSFRNVHITTGGAERKLRLTNPPDQQISDRWDPIQSRPDDTRFTLEPGLQSVSRTAGQ